MKPNQAQCRKNWAAANRALRCSDAVLPNNDNGHFAEFNLNPFRDYRSDNGPEHYEPPQKSAITPNAVTPYKQVCYFKCVSMYIYCD